MSETTKLEYLKLKIAELEKQNKSCNIILIFGCFFIFIGGVIYLYDNRSYSGISSQTIGILLLFFGVFLFIFSLYVSYKSIKEKDSLIEEMRKLAYNKPCPKCKKAIPEGNFAFCPHCGEALT